MSDPIKKVRNLGIMEGKLEVYKQFTLETTEWNKPNRLRTDAIFEFMKEDGTGRTILIVFPDAEAMQAHMQGFDEFPNKTREIAQAENIQIYGHPNEMSLETMKMISTSGITFDIKLQAIGDFVRYKSE